MSPTHGRAEPGPAEFSVTKQVEFDAGHRVPLHGSKCRSPHGHRYVVKATCTGTPVEDRGEDEGMVVDFAELKDWLLSEVGIPLDHSFMLYEDDVPMRLGFEAALAAEQRQESAADGTPEGACANWRVVYLPVVPTAENLAKWCFERLEPLVNAHWRRNVTLHEVEVWETPTSVARYRPRT